MTGILAFLWICLLVFFASSKVTVQGRVSRIYFQNTQDPVLFNGVLFLTIAALMAIIFPIIKPSTTMLLYALGVAFFSFLFQTCYALAMVTGPISLTVLFACFSLFIPVTASIILYDERIYQTQIIGILFLILCMLLNLKRGKDSNAPKFSWKWLIAIALTILSNGLATMLQKIYGRQSIEIKGADTTFLCLTYLLAAMFAFLFYFARRSVGTKPKASYRIGKNILLYALAIGAILTIYQKCYIYALVKIDTAILLPTQNGLQSILMTLIGIFLFKDKLSIRQIGGIVCGIVCVVLMNLPYDFIKF